MDKKHHDCRNFIPVDVAKGICAIKNKEVLIDTPVCDKFEELPKCKNCKNFSDSDENNIGICTGFEKENWTFGDLRAVNCEHYCNK